MRMADIHDKRTRSFNMSRIRSKDTQPEMLVRKFLFSRGLRYRLHAKYLPGKPDIVLPKYKTVIFVNGCFWHGHELCKYASLPKTRLEWWQSKIELTAEKDQRNYEILKSAGWNVVVVWGCELKGKKSELFLSELITKLTPGV